MQLLTILYLFLLFFFRAESIDLACCVDVSYERVSWWLVMSSTMGGVQ